jgi:hypothetical protein
MKTTHPRISDLDGTTWHQLPRDGGQIVDVTYAVDGEYLYRRSHDRSDGEMTVTRQHIDETGEVEFEPWNGQLPDTDGDEEAVYADGLADMMEALERHGDKFTGNNVADEAQGWLDENFSAEEADEWCDIGVWDALTAATLRDAGVTPSKANDAAQKLIDAEIEAWEAIDLAAAKDDPENWTPCERDSQYTDGDPIYSACNNDTNANEIVEAAKQ